MSNRLPLAAIVYMYQKGQKQRSGPPFGPSVIFQFTNGPLNLKFAFGAVKMHTCRMSYFMCLSNEGSGKHARMCRLATAFADRLNEINVKLPHIVSYCYRI